MKRKRHEEIILSIGLESRDLYYEESISNSASPDVAKVLAFGETTEVSRSCPPQIDLATTTTFTFALNDTESRRSDLSDLIYMDIKPTPQTGSPCSIQRTNKSTKHCPTSRLEYAQAT